MNGIQQVKRKTIIRMKSNYFILSLVALLFTGMLTAQTDLVWDAHGVGFSVPDDFQVETNNREEFSAGNDALFLSIAPIQDRTIMDEDLVDAVVAMAEGMDFDRIHEGDAIDIDDFTGYYVKGRKDGANAVVMALLDKESSTNLLVVIFYADGYEDTAIAMLASFYAYD